jgi:hypothetical protein
MNTQSVQSARPLDQTFTQQPISPILNKPGFGTTNPFSSTTPSAFQPFDPQQQFISPVLSSPSIPSTSPILSSPSLSSTNPFSSTTPSAFETFAPQQIASPVLSAPVRQEPIILQPAIITEERIEPERSIPEVLKETASNVVDTLKDSVVAGAAVAMHKTGDALVFAKDNVVHAGEVVNETVIIPAKETIVHAAETVQQKNN